MERVDRDGARVDAGVLDRREEPIAVRVELLRRVQDLKHVDLVFAVGGVVQPVLRLACARGSSDRQRTANHERGADAE